jgi:hypothetical protein
MKKRDNGYVLDTTYPIFFYKEMQPLWLSTIVNFQGFHSPDISKPFFYLELGCATGINILIAAISNPNSHFVGIDFNKEHIEIAQSAVNFIGLKNVEFIYTDFDTFLQTNKQKFDFIVNHGTFSWISSINQKSILEIVSKSLNDNGIFYLHYMCHPGSTPLLPIQKLLNIVDYHTNEPSNISIEKGINLFNQLNKVGTFIDNPKIDSISKSLEQDSSYLAHEFLTDYWNPLYSIDVHQMVSRISKATFIGSANSIENLDNISIPSKILPILQNISSPVLREYIKDLARNQKQRVDIFQKNPILFTNEEHFSTIKKIKFKLLPNTPKEGGIIFKTPIGDIEAPKEVISPLLEKLAKENLSFDELLKLSSFANQPSLLFETALMLMWASYIYPISLEFESFNKNYIYKFEEWTKKNKINLKFILECGTVI